MKYLIKEHKKVRGGKFYSVIVKHLGFARISGRFKKISDAEKMVKKLKRKMRRTK